MKKILLMVSAGLLIVSCGQSDSDLKDEISASHGTFIQCIKYVTKTYSKLDASCLGDGDSGALSGVGILVPGQRQYIQTWGTGCLKKTYKNGREINSERVGDQLISEKAGECE